MPLPIAALVFTLMLGLICFQTWMQFSPHRKRSRALIDAIARGDLAAIRQMVDPGFSLNFNYWSHISWSSMGSPLSMAATKQDPAIAEFLMANGASMSPKSPGNKALLARAVHGGNFKLIDSALAAGHDIHFKPDKCSKPLARAIHHNSVAMARFLISRGADKNDLSAGDCRWHTMRGETILLVRELGMDVPQDVLAAVQNGEWDQSAPAKGS